MPLRHVPFVSSSRQYAVFFAFIFFNVIQIVVLHVVGSSELYSILALVFDVHLTFITRDHSVSTVCSVIPHENNFCYALMGSKSACFGCFAQSFSPYILDSILTDKLENVLVYVSFSPVYLAKPK